MEKHEIEFLNATVGMINDSKDPKKTARRMEWLIGHIADSEIENRNYHKKWVQSALDNDESETVDFNRQIGEYVTSNLFK
jgi:hypothetical protein